MHINAFIVDDEVQTRETLQALLQEFCPEVNITGIAATVPEALSGLRTQKIDILFLDINLGNNTTGFDLLDMLRGVSYEVVFVTAYEEYALKAFEYAALNYLLKPVNRNKLIDTVNRVKKKKAAAVSEPPASRLLSDKVNAPAYRITLNHLGTTYLVSVDDILLLEAKGSYTIFYLTENRSYTQSKGLKHFEEMLSVYPQFVKVHRSYVVNKHHVVSYKKDSGKLLLTNDIIVPVSISYRSFIELL
ncbi:LytR/AlgR family response regulator transcription factor [Chitinophagaceae bacterium MMS25-I14]